MSVSVGPDPVPALLERLAALCVERGLRVATAESCTGGLIGHLITGIPGASTWYLGGVVAYANEVKAGLLGVPGSLFVEHGAVSEPVARAMAEGVRSALGVDLGVSVTGIAGPGGATPAKPVGLTWVAVAGRAGTEARRSVGPGGRDENKRAAAIAALELLIQVAEAA